jgi:amino acid transporter
MLPGSPWLRQVSAGHKVPANATLFTAALALAVVALSYVDLGAVNVNALVVSYAVVGIYLSFQAVVVARLVAAARGFAPRQGPGLFSLGRFGVPVAVLALAYGVAMIVNLCWPRPADSLASWLTLASALTIVLPGLAIVATRRFD